MPSIGFGEQLCLLFQSDLLPALTQPFCFVR